MRPFPAVLLVSLAFLASVVFSGCGSTESEESDIPITTSSSAARASFLEGRDAFDVGRLDDAAVHFDKAIASDSTFALACYYRTRTATSSADWRHYADLAERHASSASKGEQLLIAMLRAETQSDLPESTALARSLKNRYPRSPRALVEYAAMLAANKNTYEERALLEQAIDLNGLFAPALRALATSYLFEDPRNLHEAERYALTYVLRYPEVADSHILLGDVYRADMHLEEARGEYTRAMTVDNNSYIAYVKRGHALTFIGLYRDARKDFARATELGTGPAKARAANYRTFTWIYAGQLEDALHENEALLNSLPLLGYDESVDFLPYMNTTLNRFLMCTEARAFDQAEAALVRYRSYARAIAQQINTPNYQRTTESEIALLEGRLALQRGDYVAAMGHTDRSLDFLRDIRSARKKENTELLIGTILLAQKDFVHALEHFDEANPDLIQVKFYRALALEHLGRVSDAQELFREVGNWDFNDIEYALIRNKAISMIH
ncbi:MAG: hypothetical protein IH600_02920 [Bacteroidetes bacterium]|nr:hypothetical protein [Bacteroidota bacterium]